MAYSSYFSKGYERRVHENDTLFINLYVFKDRRREPFIDKEKYCVDSLKGQVINDLPMIGSFCKSKCILEDVKFFTSHADYRFRFEKEAIRVNGGTPIKVIRTLIIEARYYFKRGIAAVLANGEEEEKSVLSIIYTIEGYVKLKLSSGLEFTYVSPRYKELTLDKTQIEVINEFLKFKLRANELDGVEGNDRSIKLDGFTTRIQDDSNLLKCFSPKAKLKIIEFYYKDFDGKKQKVTLSENGKLTSSVFLEVKAFEEIVRLIYLVKNCLEVKEFLTPVEFIIDEYCNFVHKEMLEEARGRQRLLICDELKDMLSNYSSSVVYLNTVMNVLIKLCQMNRKPEDVKDTEVSQYLYLTEFLQLYLKKKHNINLTERDVGDYFQILNKLIAKTDKDECRLIEALTTYKP